MNLQSTKQIVEARLQEKAARSGMTQVFSDKAQTEIKSLIGNEIKKGLIRLKEVETRLHKTIDFWAIQTKRFDAHAVFLETLDEFPCQTPDGSLDAQTKKQLITAYKTIICPDTMVNDLNNAIGQIMKISQENNYSPDWLIP